MNTSPGNIAHGDSIIQERLAPSTKRQYGDKMKHFEEWVRIVHFEELVDEDTDEIDYEKVSAEILKEFLGHISKAESLEEPYVYHEPERLQSVQHVNGYKSAITDHFRVLGIALDFESKIMFSEVMTGYHRVIQKNKMGKCTCTEEKSPLSFSGYRYLCSVIVLALSDIYRISP